MSELKKLKSLSDWKGLSEEALKGHDAIVDDIIKKFPERVKVSHKGFTPVKFDRKLTRIGLEVEVENVIHDIGGLHWWQMKGDPSLRNHGYEFFSAYPCRDHEQVSHSLGEMDYILKKLKEHEFSWRTCIQIHADMTQLNVVELCNFLLFYCFLEPLLFKSFAEQRRNSIYCVPLFESDFFTDKGDTTQVAGLFAHAQERDDVNWAGLITKIWPDKQAKYSAINFSRIPDLCTVEFRHLAGTSDMKKISDWISIIVLLLKKAKSNETLYDSIKEINTLKGHQDYLESIFGDKAELLLFPGFDKYLSEGARKCKELVSLINKKVKAMTKIAPKGAIVSHLKTVKDKREARLKRSFS